MRPSFALLLLTLSIGGCSPPQVATTDLQPCTRQHVLEALRIELPCGWQLDRNRAGEDVLHRLSDRGNTVLLQTGKIWNTSSHYDADSSLKASFSERRIAGTIGQQRNTKFIYGSKALRSRRGDSLFLYLEDTARWNYYHFDGEFADPQKMRAFIEAVERSELIAP